MRLSFLLIFFSIFGFSQTETYQFPKISSSVSIPVNLPISEIQRLVNQQITGVLYEDQDFENNNSDQLKTKVEKDGNIAIKALTNNRLMFSVPLKIWAEKGLGTLGIYTYQETNFKMVMNFISNLDFQQNWSLKTNTTTAGFVWKEKPVLDFGKVKIPLTSIIEGVLIKQQKEFTSVIDTQIQQKMNMQPYLVMAWNQFAAPIQVSEEYNTWLKIKPQTVKMSPLEVYADKIKSTISVDLFSETFTGIKPAANPLVKNIPNYIPAQNLGNNFIMKTTANIPFTEANAIAKKQFQGKEFDMEKSKIKVDDIKIYPENDLVVIEIKTSGNSFLIKEITFPILKISCLAERKSAFGRVDCAPISIKSAPSVIIFSACKSADFSSLNFPPSEKESGVRLRIPIILGVDKSMSFPLQLIE